jgi:hypothetical protein
VKIPAKELRAAFEVVDAVPDDAAVDSSHYIRLQQNQKQLSLTLTGTLWGAAMATGDGGGKWTGYIDRRILKAFLSSCDSGDVEIYYKDKLTFKAHSRIDLGLHPPIPGYEGWNPASTFDLTPELKAILALSTEYLPYSAGTDNIAAVSLRKNYGVLVTNSLFISGVLGVKLPVDVLIPPAVATLLGGKLQGKLAVDKDGVGISLDGAFLYEPRSSKLSTYPQAACEARLKDAAQSPTLAKASVKDLLGVFQEAKGFLMDKTEAGVLGNRETSLQLTVALRAGTFRRVFDATLIGKLPEAKLAVRKFLPWLEHAAKVKKDAQVEIAKVQGALVMRFLHGKVQYVFIAADL